MAVKQIIFGRDMVRAIMEWRKLQTRRIVSDRSVEPPYKAGDFLWVRETWHKDADDRFHYRADYGDDAQVAFWWKPSIHMPKEAARTFLVVDSVRMERLQEIDDWEALAEGASSREEFAAMWDDLLKPVGMGQYGWDANPVVWVITFHPVDKPRWWPT